MANRETEHYLPERKGLIMFRKIMLVALPAMTLIVALGVENSASQAFAKGGMEKGGRMSRDHRGFDRFHHFDRYRWYGYGYAEPVAEVPVATPVCATCEVAPVTPACPTCAPAVTTVTPEYLPAWGFGKDYRHERDRRHREYPLTGVNHGGRK
jgi:hypothetical protein